MRRRLPRSAEIEAQIDELLAVGTGKDPRGALSELAKLGGRLIIHRAVEDEFDAWLHRGRYERRPDHQRGLRSFDSGRETAVARGGCRRQRASSRSSSRRCARPRSRSCLRSSRTRRSYSHPALGGDCRRGFVRGLSMGDVESLCEEAGLSKLSKSTASRICTELRERFEQFKRRDLCQVRLAPCSWT